MTEEQEKQLRIQLDGLHKWPDMYLFKFILPNDEEKIKDLCSNFGETCKISQKLSKNGNYMAVSIREVMLSTDAVIDRYKSVKKIEGLMSL